MSEVLLIFLAAYFFTELFLLEVLLICSAFYFANYLNIPMLGYLLGMCFILLGWALLLDNLDLFTGGEYYVEYWTYQVCIIVIYSLYWERRI